MDAQVNHRVVRGPDWERNNQDGGEGHVGTVVKIADKDNAGHPISVFVKWDFEKRSEYKYRCGRDGKYDLRALDTGPASNSNYMFLVYLKRFV